MKKIIGLIFAVMLIFIFTGCGVFTPPPSMEAVNSIKLFENEKLNGINFAVEKLFIRRDLSGYITYIKENTTVADEKEHLFTALDEINEAALGEGNFQAGYRILYIHDESVTKNGDGVKVKIEFNNINHTGGDVNIKTLEYYLENSVIEQDEINYNFIDVKTGEISGLEVIEDKSNLYIAEYKRVVNKAQTTFEGCQIIAYYVQNPDGDYVTVEKNTIFTLTEEYYVLYTMESFPLWTVFLAAALLFILIAATVIRYRKKDKLKSSYVKIPNS